MEEYIDRPEGVMEVAADGSGRFTRITLRPTVTIGTGSPARATALHEEAQRMCFIANSVNFPILHEPTVRVRQPSK